MPTDTAAGVPRLFHCHQRFAHRGVRPAGHGERERHPVAPPCDAVRGDLLSARRRVREDAVDLPLERRCVLVGHRRPRVDTGRADLYGISQLFSTSPEFTNRYGALSNRAFVRLVYRNVMGREL